MSTTETDYIFDKLYEHTEDYMEERMNDIMSDLKEDFHVREYEELVNKHATIKNNKESV